MLSIPDKESDVTSFPDPLTQELVTGIRKSERETRMDIYSLIKLDPLSPSRKVREGRADVISIHDCRSYSSQHLGSRLILVQS